MRRSVALALSFSCAGPTLAQDFSLDIPIDCALGEDQPCYIQNYVDADPGPETADFTCQALSYDGHKGTDFALRSQAEIANNVPVLAAAPGRVKGTRDGVPDTLYTNETAAAVAGKECGNGLVIDHGNGWETQYCHLKQGSLQVRSGDQVVAGDVLGAVGLSGKTQFPHLHISVRKDGAPVDPFNPTGAQTCQIAPNNTLWSSPLSYQAGGIINAGFSNDLPTYDAVKSGTAHSPVLPSDSPALVLWGFAFGSRSGDVLSLEIQDDNNRTVFEQSIDLTKTQAQFFRASGRKTNGAAWFRPGTYTGIVEMIRDGAVISDTTTTLTVTE